MAALLLAGIATLGGCSSIDDMFAAEPDAVTAGGAPVPGSQGVPGKDQPTPNLGTVPDQAPKSQTTAAERQKIADQLIADNRQVQYADKVNKPEQIEAAPPARTPSTPNKGKTDQKSDTPAKPEPGVSTTAPAPSAPTASVQMGAAATQGAAPSAAAPALIASNPGSPSATALSPTPPPTMPAPSAAPPPQTAGMPMPGSIPSPPPLPPVLQEAQAPATASPPPAAPAPAVPAMAPPPVAPPPAAAPAGQPETVVISGRSPRPLTEYIRKSAIAALVATVYFPENSAQIKPEDVTVLRQLALEQAKRGGTFRVVSVARAPIADARAQEVAKILIDRGVNPGRVYAGTVPQTDPTFGQLRAESDPSNRRVDVYLDY
jgi:outer membrane protein OmpA-like peptidoglycan-associated protein